MAGQGFNPNSVDPDYQEIMYGKIMEEDQPVVLQIMNGQIFQTNRTSGSVAFMPWKDKHGSKSDLQKDEIAFDALPDEEGIELDSVEYSFTGAIKRATSIPKVKADELADIKSDEDFVQFMLRATKKKVNTVIDSKGQAIFASATLNETVAVTAVWTNLTDARPVTDIEALADKTGSPTTAFIGRDRIRLLQKLPAFREEVAHFNGVNGSASITATLAKLRELVPSLTDIFVGDLWYHNDNPAQALKRERLFDGLFWMGHLDALKAVELESVRDATVEYQRLRQRHYAQCVEAWEFKRLEKSAGGVITGITG